mgnify:CR=1 FL=1
MIEITSASEGLRECKRSRENRKILKASDHQMFHLLWVLQLDMFILVYDLEFIQIYHKRSFVLIKSRICICIFNTYGYV